MNVNPPTSFAHWTSTAPHNHHPAVLLAAVVGNQKEWAINCGDNDPDRLTSRFASVPFHHPRKKETNAKQRSSSETKWKSKKVFVFSSHGVRNFTTQKGSENHIKATEVCQKCSIPVAVCCSIKKRFASRHLEVCWRGINHGYSFFLQWVVNQYK